MPARHRADMDGTHQAAARANRKIVYATQSVCGICGQPVDFSLKFPHPLSACVDHIIPVAKGGHPSDLKNMQLAHLSCNRMKSDKLYITANKRTRKEPNNRNLPQSCKWSEW